MLTFQKTAFGRLLVMYFLPEGRLTSWSPRWSSIEGVYGGQVRPWPRFLKTKAQVAWEEVYGGE